MINILLAPFKWFYGVLKNIYNFFKEFKDNPDIFTLRGMTAIHGQEKGTKMFHEYIKKKYKDEKK